MTDYLRIAQIVKPHGVQGALKLMPLTNDTKRFHGLDFAYLERADARERVALKVLSVADDCVIVSIDGVDDRADAEKLRNAYLCVDREHAVNLAPGEFFYADLYGCECFDTEGVSYGKLTDVYFTGANDVFEINGKKKLLIPALKKLLVDVDTKNSRIILDANVLKEVGLFED